MASGPDGSKLLTEDIKERQIQFTGSIKRERHPCPAVEWIGVVLLKRESTDTRGRRRNMCWRYYHESRRVGRAISYHPANKDVTLRLLPVSGGEIQVLAKLFGGQGTINVPSWSPDSKQLAFVSYRLIEP